MRTETLTPRTSSRAFGKEIEDVAENYLHKQGLSTVERNYTCRIGEIGLIMLHEKALVFVEVRYRRSAEFGDAAESVTLKKQRRVIRTAQHFTNVQR